MMVKKNEPRKGGVISKAENDTKAKEGREMIVINLL